MVLFAIALTIAHATQRMYLMIIISVFLLLIIAFIILFLTDLESI